MIKIIKFRKNDLNPETGKQVEFNQNVVSSFLKFSKDEVQITITYKSLDGKGSLNNKKYQNNLKLSPSRGDYKIYTNPDQSKNIKDLFIEDLKLNEEDNINDYFALVKNDDTNYDLYYIPATTSISVFLGAIKNKAFDFTSENDNSVKEEETEIMSKVIIEDKTLNKALYETFKFLINRFGEEVVLQDIKRKESKIKDKTFNAIGFNNYFNNDNILIVSDEELTKADLTSSSILRYFDTNLNIKIATYTYFSTQWNGTDSPGRSLGDFNNFLNDISDGELKIIKEGELYKLKENKVHSAKSHQSKREGFGTNKIFFGAPGTGKSYAIKQETNGLGDRVRRVTFHPDYDYASFVGGYMPITEKENGTDVIKYKFAPQIFSQIYSDAWLDEGNRDYYLIIEEINRGNCAEIFGDIFQILDRKTQYPISATKEMVAFLNTESRKKGIERHTGLGDGDTLSLPPNLHIWATMNTSDQSLYPMDSAFKRRWDWVYMPICYKKTYEDKFDDNGQPLKNESSDFKIRVNDSHYPWLGFIEEVNKHISTNKSLGMDKCIGNYFIEPSKDGYIELSDFIHKVIFYLWDDVFKDETESIFDENESYESFFPINTTGADKIIKLFENLNVNSLPTDEITD